VLGGPLAGFFELCGSELRLVVRFGQGHGKLRGVRVVLPYGITLPSHPSQLLYEVLNRTSSAVLP
jgi:hypothetical protein